MPRDYYELLGVERSAGEAEIKKAFRRRARELHPDVNAHDPEAEERFKEVAEAYEVLSDPQRRSTYDRFGHEGLRSGGWAPRAQGFGSIQDLFDTFFGGRDPFGFGGAARSAGADVAVRIEVTLEEVLSGATREVEYEAVARCEHCNGNGAEPGTPIRRCERCDGSGQLQQVSRTPFGQLVRTLACDACGGDGRIAETPCGECAGAGRLARLRTWEVEVPPGIEAGQRIRIGGAGHAGEAGMPPGDLYVEVAVAPDERFERHGNDLISVVTVSAVDAMLGTKVDVPTLEGAREVDVPAGTQPGAVLVLRGQGLPPLHGGRRGDQRLLVKVVVPASLSEEQRELAARLGETLGAENLRGEDGGLFARMRRAFG